MAAVGPSSWTGFAVLVSSAFGITAALIPSTAEEALETLLGVALIGLGVALIGLGVASFRAGHLLFGVAGIGAGVALIGLGVAGIGGDSSVATRLRTLVSAPPSTSGSRNGGDSADEDSDTSA